MVTLYKTNFFSKCDQILILVTFAEEIPNRKLLLLSSVISLSSKINSSLHLKKQPKVLLVDYIVQETSFLLYIF